MTHQPRSVESSICRVELFRDKALVTRRARVAEGASGEIRLGGLPLGLEDQSVRVRVLGKRTRRVRDLRVEWDLAHQEEETLTAHEERLQELFQEQTALRLALRRRQAHLEAIELLRPSSFHPTDLPEQIAFQQRRPLEAWLSFAEFSREALQDGRKESRRLQRALQDMEDRITEAVDQQQRRSEAERSALALCGKAVVLWTEVDQQAAELELELELSYLIAEARWYPQYELRVGRGGDQAELVVRALVAQRTGEDWPRASFAFSTADLARSAALPELDSWRIGKAQPRRASGWRPLPENLEELFGSYDAGVRRLPAPEIPPAPFLPAMPSLELDTARGEVTDGVLGMFTPDDDDFSQTQRVYAHQEPELRSEPVPCAEPPEQEACAYASGPVMDEMADLDHVEPGAPLGSNQQPPPPPAPMPALSRASAPRASKRSPSPLSGAYREHAKEKAGGLSITRVIAADRGALSYGGLRLQGPESGRGRGQLQAVSARERLLEQLGDQASTFPADQVLEEMGQAGALVISPPQHCVPPARSSGHFATRYEMESPGQVAADGQLHSLTLLRRQGPTRRTYRCVPLSDPSVYELALFDNPLQLPLLAGPVQIFKGGDFIVQAPLETTPPARPLTVNLGVEPRLKVARNTAFSESTSGLFGGETVLLHRVELELRSNLDRDVRLEVFERIPTSGVEEVKVEVLKMPQGAEPYDQAERGEPLRGGWRLTFELKAQSTERHVLSYQISLPSKQVLVGGNRRD